MKTFKVKQSNYHSYLVTSNDDEKTDQIFPTVHMEMNEESSLSDHLYAFERFLQAIGFTMPPGCHLGFVDNE